MTLQRHSKDCVVYFSANPSWPEVLEPFATASGLQLLPVKDLIEAYVFSSELAVIAGEEIRDDERLFDFIRSAFIDPAPVELLEEFPELVTYAFEYRYLIIGKVDLPEDMVPYFTIEPELNQDVLHQHLNRPYLGPVTL